ncbi:MAG TPA: 2-dehydropantoate 2-reductase [Steroidobacteraceae bacterium]|nr:2-dehydropantoate 2-reductase [Gammaproteobacteria bacterium]HEV2286051.1 2-dehydropantoate 2-reductase [Steroidobacteraceae bacterium]
MRIAIVGAGAVGGYVGVKLALAGERVTFLARGANLEAIRRDGVKLRLGDGTELIARDVQVTADYTAAGPQDLVILAVKAHQVGAVVAEVPKLFDPGTCVVTMQNGIPYWYFHRHGGPFEGRGIAAVDPAGACLRGIPPDRVIGCVVYPASVLEAPGVIRHIEGDRFPVGELDGSASARVHAVSHCFTAAGFQAPVLDNIRAEIWLKLWGNLTFNPISALTRATLVDICRFPPTRKLAAAMMTEAQAVAHRLAITFRVPIERRIAGAERVGAHKTSMLQDLEAGRTLETEALLGAVLELAHLTETTTPTLEAVYALVKLLGRPLE